MSEIAQLIGYLQVLIPIGAGARAVYCYIMIYINNEEEKSYKDRIRNAIIFVALSETVSGLLRVIIPMYLQ